MKKFLKENGQQIGCYLFLISALFYLVIEAICVRSTSCGWQAYLTHTISELGVPFSVTSFSKYYFLMEIAFLVVGPCYMIGYHLLFRNILTKRKELCLFLTYTLWIGVSMVGLFHCESKYLFFHFFGTVLCFTSGTILNILTVLYLDHCPKFYKLTSILLGVIGIASATLMIIFPSSSFTPLIERMTILPVLIFEIMTALRYLTILHNKNKTLDVYMGSENKA